MPAHYQVRMLPEASGNLIAIHEHIEKDSPQNATAVARMLIDAIDSLEQFPHRYKVHRSATDPDLVVRSMPVPPFIVYYRVDESDRVVEVMTVRHGSRRRPRRLG